MLFRSTEDHISNACFAARRTRTVVENTPVSYTHLASAKATVAPPRATATTSSARRCAPSSVMTGVFMGEGLVKFYRLSIKSPGVTRNPGSARFRLHPRPPAPASPTARFPAAAQEAKKAAPGGSLFHASIPSGRGVFRFHLAQRFLCPRQLGGGITQRGAQAFLDDRVVERHFQHARHGQLLLHGPGQQMADVLGAGADHFRAQERCV